MKRRQLVVLLIALILLTGLITTFVYVKSSVVAVQTVPMDVTVDSSFAFNLDTDAIHFGRIIPGHGGQRGFVLNNTKDIDLVAEVRSTGSISDWVTVSSNYIEVPASDFRRVNLSIEVPGDTAFGKYDGELIVIFRRS